MYRNTTWDDEFTGYGVQIQQVRTTVTRVCVCGRRQDHVWHFSITTDNIISVCNVLVLGGEVRSYDCSTLIEFGKAFLEQTVKALCVGKSGWGSPIGSSRSGDEWRHCASTTNPPLSHWKDMLRRSMLHFFS